jgi:hypothetical protein
MTFLRFLPINWIYVLVVFLFLGFTSAVYLKGRYDAIIEVQRHFGEQDRNIRHRADEVRRDVQSADDAALDRWLREWTRPGP